MNVDPKTVTQTLLLMLALLVAGCENNPVNRLINPTASNTTNGTWSGVWTIYDDEVRTGGTIMSFTTPEGQELDFSWLNNPSQGPKCIKFSWDGSEVTEFDGNTRENAFVGFSFIVAPSVDQYNSISKDLTPGAFTKVTFKARGSLNLNVILRVESPTSKKDGSNTNADLDVNAWESKNHILTSDWQTFSFTISDSQDAVHDFVKVILKNTASPAPSNGGVVYIDDIQLTR